MYKNLKRYFFVRKISYGEKIFLKIDFLYKMREYTPKH